MMRLVFGCAVRVGMCAALFAGVGAHMTVSAQNQQTPNSRRPIASALDVSLRLKQHNVQGDLLVIQYNIPYSGMVEVRIFDADNQLVKRNQYIQRDGDNEIRLKADRLPAGNYVYKLTYKGNDRHSNFTWSGGSNVRQRP